MLVIPEHIIAKVSNVIGVLKCRYAMDSVDWAMNAAQINRDIRLANEHLPPGMQVCSLSASFCCSSSSLLHQYSPDEPPRWRRIVHHALSPCSMVDAIPTVEHVWRMWQVSAIELPACERPFAFSPEHDPSSPASDSVPANGPFAAMSGSR